MDAAALELRRLAALVETLSADVQHLHLRLLARDERAIGLRLLPAIARLTDGQPFGVPDLAALALNAMTPAGGVVRDVLADHGDADGGLRSFGRLLARLAGAPLGEHRLVAEGRCRDGVRYRVTRVSER